jgi:hypothetical protein
MLAAVAVDLLAGLTWWPAYFRIGIPLFVRRQPFPQALAVLPGSKVLAESYSSAWVVPILFRRLSSTEIAVREAFWGGFLKFTYTPLVHGLLEADPIAREIKIVGRANAFPLVFLAAFAVPLSIRMSASDPVAIPFLVFLFGSLLLIQFVRYGKVLHETLKLMEQKNGHA